MKLTCMLALLVTLIPASALASQFGLSQGESLAEVSKATSLKKVEPYMYSAPALPNGNVAFDDYRLVITPGHGLCKIIAWTPSIQSSAYGDAVKDKFTALYDALNAKYGKSERLDFLRSGSIWDDPRDWMMGLVKKERYLEAVWTAESGASLSPDVQAIGLSAHGVSSSNALISLGYEFKNFNDCEAEIKAAANSSL